MSTADSAARRTLLVALLEAHERSTAFGRPAPWTRDVKVDLDRDSFPDAFADDGQPQLQALRDAARELGRQGVVRVVEHKGVARGEIKELRIGPDEIDRAVAAGESVGFEPLGLALSRLRAAIAPLVGPGPPWLDELLQQVEGGAARADLSVLGISRERFKRDAADVVDALRAAVGLWRGLQGWERVVSERLFFNSKRLAAVRGELARLLLRLDPRFDGLDAADVGDVVEVLGVRRKPAFVHCAGDVCFDVAGRTYRLGDFAPTAQIPEAWLPSLASASTSVRIVTTIENEVPFFAYVEDAGGAVGLGDRGELAVYTGGFPGPHLVSFLAALRATTPHQLQRHWGDADLGGVRIWWYLRQRLGPLAIFRSDAAFVDQNAAAGSPLPHQQRGALFRLRQKVSEVEGDDVGAALALIDAIRRANVRLEQELWYSDAASRPDAVLDAVVDVGP